MEDVTDTVFRQVIAEAGRPDVFFTEFTNVEGMDSPGSDEVAQRLKFTKGERPIVAQIWGRDPKKFLVAATTLKAMGFDGIDINFGCPVRDVVKRGACAAMIDPEYRSQVGEILVAVKEGAADLPVSVKTRIGVRQIATEEWIGFLLTQGLAAITIHGRTAVQMSEGQVDWAEIGKAVALRNQVFGLPGLQTRVLDSRKRGPAARARFASLPPFTLIVGNGDVESRQEALEKVAQYGVDGVMIGRGVFKNPWVFSRSDQTKSKPDRMKLLSRHVNLWSETWGDQKHFAVFKKYIKMYVNGFDGAADLRAQLMATKSLAELETAIAG